MVEFDYRQERLRSGEIIFRPVAKVYLLKSDRECVFEYFDISFQQRKKKTVFVWQKE